MKQVNLNKLPRYASGSHRGNIDWEKSVGKEVPFIYEDITGIINIIAYNKEDGSLKAAYGNKQDDFYICNFRKGQVGRLVSPDYDKVTYKANIGDTYLYKNTLIEILDRRFILRGSRKWKQYLITYKGKDRWINEYDMFKYIN